MHIEANNIDLYLKAIPTERQEAFGKLWEVISNSIPDGYEAGLNYGMPSYYVPHSAYPDGYHCNPELPLPFVSIASQKNFIALYHSGIYADTKLHDWFVKEYPKHSKYKLDMGKSCIRFKKMDHIPLKLIAELMGKMSMGNWIKLYLKKVVNR